MEVSREQGEKGQGERVKFTDILFSNPKISETRFLHIPHHNFSLRMMKPGFSLHHDCREKWICDAQSNVTKMVMLGCVSLHPTYEDD
jgi:hypothetical protein